MGACFLVVCSWQYHWVENNNTQSYKYGPITLITIAWFCMFYAFLFHQSYTHHCAYVKQVEESKSKSDGVNRINLMRLKAGMYEGTDTVYVTNTTVRNTIEQSLTFIPLLWLCACLGGEQGIAHATAAGWVWVLTRSIYPIVYGLGAPWFFLSTLPGYGAQLYLANCIVQAMMVV